MRPTPSIASSRVLFRKGDGLLGAPRVNGADFGVVIPSPTTSIFWFVTILKLAAEAAYARFPYGDGVPGAEEFDSESEVSGVPSSGLDSIACRKLPILFFFLRTKFGKGGGLKRPSSLLKLVI